MELCAGMSVGENGNLSLFGQSCQFEFWSIGTRETPEFGRICFAQSFNMMRDGWQNLEFAIEHRARINPEFLLSGDMFSDLRLPADQRQHCEPYNANNEYRDGEASPPMECGTKCGRMRRHDRIIFRP